MKRGLNLFGVLVVGLFTVLTFLAFLNPLTQFLNSIFVVSSDNFVSFQLLIMSFVMLFSLVLAFIFAIRGGGSG